VEGRGPDQVSDSVMTYACKNSIALMKQTFIVI